MPVINIFGHAYCQTHEIARQVAERTKYRLIFDKDLLVTAAGVVDMPADKIELAFSANEDVFNKFTHEKERSIAALRLAVARAIQADNLILVGFAGWLVPATLNQMLRVGIVADFKSRVASAIEMEGFSREKAEAAVREIDEDQAAWIAGLTGKNDPWNPSLYDIIIPVDTMPRTEAVGLIAKYAEDNILIPSDRSVQVVRDFLLASEVNMALAAAGHDIQVNADQGAVILTINKNVFMLQRLEEELTYIAHKVPGVQSVVTRVGEDFYQAEVYEKISLEAPAKVLLVDDEREFVQTLSERLLMREMGSTVAYDGQSALQLIQEDEPEVMVLDLKMPGIDGIEVLRRVKQTNPDVEVIILTGHGSDADRDVCMELGAFAYLRKPVDIDILSDTLKKAYEKKHRKQTQ
jgi:two-component system response regulator CpxR